MSQRGDNGRTAHKNIGVKKKKLRTKTRWGGMGKEGWRGNPKKLKAKADGTCHKIRKGGKKERITRNCRKRGIGLETTRVCGERVHCARWDAGK